MEALMNNKDKVCSFFKLLTEQKVKEAFDTYVSGEFKHHNQHTKAGRQALLEGMAAAHSQFPKTTIEVKQIFEDGNFVITHSLVKMSPDHGGFVCVHISRFHDGKIAEFWDLASPVAEDAMNADGAF
jgi:predicted SnoaL-like aldol condensation-catalyzing enzyme